MPHNSQRVQAVQKFAEEHKDDEHWSKVLELSAGDIYNVVKQTQSPEGAIRKIARMIGSSVGDDVELPAPTRTQAQAEAEKKLLEIAGTLEGTEGANPYDNPVGHSEPASAIRPEAARQAVRGGVTFHTGQMDQVEPNPRSQTSEAGGKNAGTRRGSAADEGTSK